MKNKYFYTIALLISLSIIIIFFGNLFDNNIEKVALRNNGIYELEEYKIGDGEYKIMIPKDWSIEEDIEENCINIYVSNKKTVNMKISYLKNTEYNLDILNGMLEKIESLGSIEKDNKIIDGYEWNVLIYKTEDEKISKLYYRNYEDGILLVEVSYLEYECKPSINRGFERIISSFKSL